MSDALCKAIEKCRICGSRDLRPVISLGDQYIASLFPTGPLPQELQNRFPLEVVRCAGEGSCGLVQLRHSVAPGVLYDHYGYRSGTNEMMRANLQRITKQVTEIAGLADGDLVLDIGCNDGTLLLSYDIDGLDRVGIDPSDAVKAIDRSDITVINDFFSSEMFELACPGRKAKVVTSIAMFYDLEQPQEFVGQVAKVLANDGVWVIEMSYLPSMLDVIAFDTICHEHLEYYSLSPIDRMLEAEGLRIHEAEINDVNGGSIRLFVRPADLGEVPPAAAERLEAIRKTEDALELDSDAPYEVFRSACFEMKKELRELLRKLVADGKTVYAYGASTKGNTLLQFCEIDDSLVTKAADRNPDKWGTSTIGTNIPIISEEQARSEAPDYFLVLPWHFFEGFVIREREFLKGGGAFILPLPQVRVVDAGDV